MLRYSGDVVLVVGRSSHEHEHDELHPADDDAPAAMNGEEQATVALVVDGPAADDTSAHDTLHVCPAFDQVSIVFSCRLTCGHLRVWVTFFMS